MHAKCLRFSELKPDGMESNIFMYHLKQLIRSGYVAKCDDGYRLDHLGLQYVDGLSSTNLRLRKQPKLIAILALYGPGGRWLLVERKTQPYIGQRMFLSGKQHFGETMTRHAARELQEKIGVDIPLQYRGLAEISIHESGELLTQVVAHIHYGELQSDALPPPTTKFTFVWHDFANDTEPLMAGTRAIAETLSDAASTPFVMELNVPA
jgi:8-oxo-dGTP pyrophosphatase MutT (NUDIX family)